MAMRLSLVLTILLMLCACTSTKYVEVPVVTYKVVNDSIVSVKVKVDSIFERDSIFVNQYIKGDTVYCDKVSYVYRYRDKLRIDTLHHWNVDSVLMNHTRIVEVEKPPTIWQSFIHYLGILGFAVIVVFLIKGIIWSIKKIGL